MGELARLIYEGRIHGGVWQRPTSAQNKGKTGPRCVGSAREGREGVRA